MKLPVKARILHCLAVMLLPLPQKPSTPVLALSALLVSPLLMSAAGEPALEDSISATCSLEETSRYAPEQTENANVSYRSSSGSQAEVSPEAEAGLTGFVRDRWNSVRRLIRENPYFTGATPEEQARAEALCLAHIQADYERLIAQAEGDALPLPDLSASPSPSGGTLSNSTSNSTFSNGRTDRPEATPVIPSLDMRSPAQPQAPASAVTIEPSNLPTAQDPSIYMGPDFEPTPFDGTVVRTLAEMPDGNYRYVAGNVEERSYSNEELRQQGNSIFVLTKIGNMVVGNLSPAIDSPGICVTSTVSGDTITGAAYPYDMTDTQQDSVAPNSVIPNSVTPNSVVPASAMQAGARQVDEKYKSFSSSALKVRKTATEGDRLYYADALLDLSSFTPINAGSSLPPDSCQTSRADDRDRG